MNKIILVIICFVTTTLCSAGSEAAAAKTQPSEDIIIYYGLNESHSRSWVREDHIGNVGIVCFQRFAGNYTDGVLLYRVINTDGSESVDTVTSGTRLEKSVMLYDSLSEPHIFVARSDNYNQAIDHYYRDSTGLWQSETIVNFYNEGGRFIYELSADTGPDHSFHLLILKTRSNIDSYDFMDAWINSYLYHMTNETGAWEYELVHNYDMAYTYDMYIKSSSRQDIKVDEDGFVHVVFSKQISTPYDPSRLMYATNQSGEWVIETAFSNLFGLVDDAGWFPSLCLDRSGVPHISCMYVNRVLTHSAIYCKLYFLKRIGPNDWSMEVVADHDDGYYGGDGRTYTGGLSHLVFDQANTPHIIFSDIASTHWPGTQRLCVGNIRYAVLDEDVWNITKVYDQPCPTAYLNAVEMHALCLIVSHITDMITVVGQELVTTGEYQYSCNLLEFRWPVTTGDCCGKFTSGLTGNTDCGEDGQITLADITRLIDFVYVSGDNLCCPTSGNTNGSEDGKITLADITRLIDRVFISKSSTAPCTLPD